MWGGIVVEEVEVRECWGLGWEDVWKPLLEVGAFGDDDDEEDGSKKRGKEKVEVEAVLFE